jgi:hypothetical protein
MFPALQLEVMNRFTAVDEHFRRSQKWTGDPALTAKGLMFVEMYAIYEYTVKAVMKAAIQEIAAHAHTYSDLQPWLLAIFLNPQLQSLRDSPAKREWESRFSLLDLAVSSAPIEAVSALPMDGTHFRHPQLLLVLKSLGIDRIPAARRRHLLVIDDVVEKRNAVSHGSETALDVGRRYSRQEIAKVSRIMKSVCLRLIALAAAHCSDPTKHCR